MQRCQLQPRTFAIAAFKPAWASEIASWTPTRPRATRPRRNSVQNASVSASPTSIERISRRPVSCTPCATDQRLGDDAAAVADLLHLGVEEQIRVAALQRPRPERLDVLVERLADAADLGLGDPQPEPLDELVDPPGRDAEHIGLLDDRQQRLLGALARLQEAREVAALPELGDLQLQLARARVPAPGPIAVAMRRAILGPALTTLRADQLGHLELHHLRRDGLDRLADHVGVLVEQHLPDDLLDRHPVGTGHAAPPFVEPWKSDDISAASAGTTTGTEPRFDSPRPIPSDPLLHQP